MPPNVCVLHVHASRLFTVDSACSDKWHFFFAKAGQPNGTSAISYSTGPISHESGVAIMQDCLPLIQLVQTNGIFFFCKSRPTERHQCYQL